MNIEIGKIYKINNKVSASQQILIKILDMEYPGNYPIKYEVINGTYRGLTNSANTTTIRRRCTEATKMEILLYD